MNNTEFMAQLQKLTARLHKVCGKKHPLVKGAALSTAVAHFILEYPELEDTVMQAIKDGVLKAKIADKTPTH